jgi:hypothetical protein
MRRAALSTTVLALALAAVPGAPAGGPNLGTTSTIAVGNVGYVTSPDGVSTTLARTAHGETTRQLSIRGSWGIPYVTIAGGAEGVSHDGRVLVLAQATQPKNTPLRSRSEFLTIDTKTLKVTRTIRLQGNFGYDALSPNGRTLYLIEHVTSADLTRYRVRAFDLASGRLLPGVIADRRQKTWLMNGYPMNRVTDGDGRWVYTLYMNPNNYPFVHALDSVSKRAVCIGLPWDWTGDVSAIETSTMKLSHGERRLTVTGSGGLGPRFVIDTRTFRLVGPAPPASA